MNFYKTCVMEANKIQNIPWVTPEKGDYLKVKVEKDDFGTSLIRGMAYEIVDIIDDVFKIQPVSEQREYMTEFSLSQLSKEDLKGIRYLSNQDNFLLIKRVNIPMLTLLHSIHRRAYGIVNQDGIQGWEVSSISQDSEDPKYYDWKGNLRKND